MAGLLHRRSGASRFRLSFRCNERERFPARHDRHRALRIESHLHGEATEQDGIIAA